MAAGAAALMRPEPSCAGAKMSSCSISLCRLPETIGPSPGELGVNAPAWTVAIRVSAVLRTFDCISVHPSAIVAAWAATNDARVVRSAAICPRRHTNALCARAVIPEGSVLSASADRCQAFARARQHRPTAVAR